MEQAPEIKEFTSDEVRHYISTTIGDDILLQPITGDHFPWSQDYVPVKLQVVNPEISSREETLVTPWFNVGIDKSSFIQQEDEVSKAVIQKLKCDPSREFQINVQQLMNDLEFFDIDARRIASIDDDGICFMFDHKDESMYLELYNDGEVSALIEDTNRRMILYLQEYSSVNEAISSVKSFLSNGFSI